MQFTQVGWVFLHVNSFPSCFLSAGEVLKIPQMVSFHRWFLAKEAFKCADKVRQGIWGFAVASYCRTWLRALCERLTLGPLSAIRWRSELPSLLVGACWWACLLHSAWFAKPGSVVARQIINILIKESRKCVYLCVCVCVWQVMSSSLVR